MKKYIFAIILFLTLFNKKTFADEMKEISMPQPVSKGAVLMDGKTGRVLWEKNSTEPLAMASTTKIVTAIITLENANLQDIVTVSKNATHAPKVKMNLEEGEEIALESLMYALMLESSNDAAIAIAEHVGGSVENFCDMMTKKAKELGADNTIFETPNGLDKGEHHSTAYDLALITRYALQNEQFIRITNTKNVNFKSNKKSYAMYNKNRLLSEYNGANGVKTGFTNKAGQCFVGAAKRNDMQLIAVVLQSGWGAKGKEQKWIDTKEILNYGFENYKYYDLLENGKIAGSFNIERSLTENMEYYFNFGSSGLELPLTEEEFKSFKIEIEAPKTVLAPVTKDEKIGVGKMYLGNEYYGEVELLAMDDATRHDTKTFMEKVLNEWFEMGTKAESDIILPEF